MIHRGSSTRRYGVVIFMVICIGVLLVACDRDRDKTPTKTLGPTEASTPEPDEEGERFDSGDPNPEAIDREEPVAVNFNSLRWLVDNSPLVFVGQISNQITEEDERGLIITRNVFAIEEVVLGDYSESEITLTTLGGTLDDLQMSVSHMPQFREGQVYLIFTDPERTTYDPITGNTAGVFRITESGELFTYTGISVIGIEEDMIQYGTLMISDLFEQDPEGMGEVDERPVTEGEVTELVPLETEAVRTLTLDEFVELIRTSSR